MAKRIFALPILAERLVALPILARSSFALPAVAVALVLAGAVASASGGAPVRVFVSIPPQKYFVERIGGQDVSVGVLVRPDQSPHAYEPTPRQMAELSEAKIFFRVGMPYEDTLLPRMQANCPELEVVDTRAGIELREQTAEERKAEVGHDHGGHGHGEHAHEEKDPHIWLSPRLAKVQAKTICDALCATEPEHAETFRANLAELMADLDRVSREIAEALAPLKGKPLYVFHPAYGYFAEEFGLKLVAVEAGGRQPSPRQLGELIARAKREGARVIFVQPQFSKQDAETIAKAIGGTVVPLDPLAEDYLKNLEDMAQKIKAGLGPAQPEGDTP